jgi:hypothetical protein
MNKTSPDVHNLQQSKDGTNKLMSATYREVNRDCEMCHAVC